MSQKYAPLDNENLKLMFYWFRCQIVDMHITADPSATTMTVSEKDISRSHSG